MPCDRLDISRIRHNGRILFQRIQKRHYRSPESITGARHGADATNSRLHLKTADGPRRSILSYVNLIGFDAGRFVDRELSNLGAREQVRHSLSDVDSELITSRRGACDWLVPEFNFSFAG
jgi:hypothetical protein